MSLELSSSSVDAEWEYSSCLADDVAPFTYRIQVNDDGTFDVNRSDAELTPKDVVRPFSTHAEALAWCNAREAEIVADEAKTTPEIVIGGEA